MNSSPVTPRGTGRRCSSSTYRRVPGTGPPMDTGSAVRVEVAAEQGLRQWFAGDNDRGERSQPRRTRPRRHVEQDVVERGYAEQMRDLPLLDEGDQPFGVAQLVGGGDDQPAARRER